MENQTKEVNVFSEIDLADKVMIGSVGVVLAVLFFLMIFKEALFGLFA